MAKTLQLLLVVLAATAVVAEDLPALPLFPSLPDPCGRVTQVQSDDTCDSMASDASITLGELKVLNPLLLCGEVALQPGSAVCTGTTIAFCNDVVVASSGDTCATIANEARSTVINVDGTNSTECSTLHSGVPVCVSPSVNQCAVNTLCGTSIPPKLQAALALLTDYCSIIAECESPFTISSVGGKDVLALSISSVTSAVAAAVDKDGHPELGQLATKLATGPATLGVSVTADWFADGGAAVSVGFADARRRSSRRMLTVTPSRRAFYSAPPKLRPYY